MCFNKKVIAGLAVVAVGVVVFAPELLGRALPFLVLAVCPLSMVFMMRGMGSMGGMKSSPDQQSDDRRGSAPQDAVSQRTEDDGATQRELEEEVNRLRAEINLRDAGRA